MGGNLQYFRSPQAPARLTLKFACLGSPSGSIGEKPLSKEGDISYAKTNSLFFSLFFLTLLSHL